MPGNGRMQQRYRDRLRRTSDRTMQRLRIPCTMAVVALVAVAAGWFALGWFAVAQQSSSAPLDAQAQEQAILAHLSAVIQFYRSTAEPIQKAGEPNDVVYRDQAIAQSAQIAQFAFDSAKAEAAFLAGGNGTGEPAAPASGQQQRLQDLLAGVNQRISELTKQQVDVNRQIAGARPRALSVLQTRKQQLQAALDLSNAMKDALDRIVSVSQDTSGTGLTASIARLQQSVPELQSGNKTSAPQITTVESALSSGVTSQGSVLIQLLETRHSLQTLLQENDALRRRVTSVRAPMSNVLRGLIAQGQQLSQQAEAPAPQGNSPQPPAPPIDLSAITGRFKALAAATVPLSQELIVIEQSRANLVAWQTSVIGEYDRILHSLLLRIVVIAIALGIIVGSGELWTKATNKYIRDIRRRRQFLIVRRVVVGFLSVIVVLFGFVTQFNSLATFAGFITAGIAVGLQTILLSVAAYFFIIGRYGIKVGDRITIATVTGDVIEVGLVRFYVMELAGSATELNPTGRIAVFSNAVLFQAGTPLFKQLPGTGYAWHELIVKLTDTTDYRTVCEAIVHVVQTAYQDYRDRIVREHESVQNWMQTTIDSPEIQSRLQFSAGVFQFWVRFPVEIRSAAQTDEAITHALLDLMASNPAIKSAIAAMPTIQASVRG
jgi:small-conductance mechanosensitive channel